jgi:hypothetical protein
LNKGIPHASYFLDCLQLSERPLTQLGIYTLIAIMGKLLIEQGWQISAHYRISTNVSKYAKNQDQSVCSSKTQ